jgi:putative transcriptional regulator
VGAGILIASPQMRDPNFERTVVLLCQHDGEGAIGLVINRDGPIPVGAVLQRLNMLSGRGGDTPTWWGGPVGPGTGFVLWRGHEDVEEGWSLGGVMVSPSAERLRQLVEARDRFHLCLGYAGWGPGQLDTEISSGSWIYTEVDPALVFEVPQPERYREALASLGLTPETVWMTPIDE